MDSDLDFGIIQCLIRLFLIVFILLVTIGSAGASNKKSLFFTCESGFKFELNQSAARCIKRTKQVFRKPLPCEPVVIDGKTRKRQLFVDSDGKFDLCMQSNKSVTLNGFVTSNQLNTLPKCPRGFGIFHRPGKDACLQTRQEEVKPPTKQVVR